MDLVRELLVVVHLVGMAMIVGGWLAVLRQPRVLTSVVWGARIQLLSGIALVGLHESGALDDVPELNRTKIAVKLLIALAVVGLAEANRKKGTAVKPLLFHAIGGLALLNVLVAVLWD
jgi:hypothetical protein